MGEQKTERRAAQNNDEINNLAEFKNHAFFPRFFFSIKSFSIFYIYIWSNYFFDFLIRNYSFFVLFLDFLAKL